MDNQKHEIQMSAEQPVQGALATGGAFSSMQAFEGAQRMAKALSSSPLVPKDYQGPNGMGSCLIALEMAQRCNANPLMVMQNLHIIHGRPSWSSQFVIAALNSCGRFSPLRFEIVGDPGSDSWGARAWAYDKNDGERLEGPLVTIGMAKAEGWYGKNGSKWKTMPELMLRYRSAKFFGNLYAPDIMMGMSTQDEVEDISGYSNGGNAGGNKPRTPGNKRRDYDFEPVKAEPRDITPKPEPEIEPEDIPTVTPEPEDLQDGIDDF